jgi:hypothetical protein
VVRLVTLNACARITAKAEIVQTHHGARTRHIFVASASETRFESGCDVMSSDWLPIGSRWLKAIRSVSIGPSATYESGHFYFAQTGHAHFAATGVNDWLKFLCCPE